MAALPPEELPELMLEIANASIKRTTRCLIEWQLHTMTRPAEAATTRWADIDFERRVWTIPPERMKKRRPHSIPLSDNAVALLESLKTHSGHREYVFPADRNPRTHANSQTANMALKRMGFQDRLVSHGMRSMASTILTEHGWDPELIKVALAHVDKDEVRSAYNRADYIERRRPMMAWWSETYSAEVTTARSRRTVPCSPKQICSRIFLQQLVHHRQEHLTRRFIAEQLGRHTSVAAHGGSDGRDGF